MLVIAKELSKNSKIGDVSATYASQASCPTTCPFFGNGCYAETGFTGFTTRRLASTTASPAEVAAEESAKIDTLSGKRPLRLHVVGDSKTRKAASIVSAAAERFTAKYGMPVWTYTHAWRKVARRFWGRVSVLASCETIGDVKAAWRKGYAAAIVVDTHESTSAYMIGDVKVIPCPQQTGKSASCATCRLCWNADRLLANKTAIAFAAHGINSDKVVSAISEQLSNHE